MSSLMVKGKDDVVLKVNSLLEHPGLKYLDLFLEDRIKYEEVKINELTKEPLRTDIEVKALNNSIQRKKILYEILSSYKESLEDFMKSSDFDFTDLGGAKYQENYNGELCQNKT